MSKSKWHIDGLVSEVPYRIWKCKNAEELKQVRTMIASFASVASAKEDRDYYNSVVALIDRQLAKMEWDV